MLMEKITMKEIILQDDEHDDNIDIECSLFGKIMKFFLLVWLICHILSLLS